MPKVYINFWFILLHFEGIYEFYVIIYTQIPILRLGTVLSCFLQGLRPFSPKIDHHIVSFCLISDAPQQLCPWTERRIRNKRDKGPYTLSVVKPIIRGGPITTTNIHFSQFCG